MSSLERVFVIVPQYFSHSCTGRMNRPGQPDLWAWGTCPGRGLFEIAFIVLFITVILRENQFSFIWNYFLIHLRRNSFGFSLRGFTGLTSWPNQLLPRQNDSSYQVANASRRETAISPGSAGLHPDPGGGLRYCWMSFFIRREFYSCPACVLFFASCFLFFHFFVLASWPADAYWNLSLRGSQTVATGHGSRGGRYWPRL